ncbi:hypothetical protein [uncultured Litoreibacter sp.]|uniref:CdiA C-terminal domain-containing protein n=1 Tax=uncultured Litoreibacter sp. TaxID=1392394 RepID=UPI00343BA29B
MAPSTNNPRSIWSSVEKKILERQTERVVINLQDSAVDLKALNDQFSTWPIEGRKDVIIIRPDGSIGGL